MTRLLRFRLRHMLFTLTLGCLCAHCMFSPFYPKIAIAGSAVELESGGREFRMLLENEGILPVWYHGGDGQAIWRFVAYPSGSNSQLLTWSNSERWTLLRAGETVQLNLKHGPNPAGSPIAIGTRFKNWSGRLGNCFTPRFNPRDQGKLKFDARHDW